MRSAVLFIIYKRESTTKRVFEAIRQAQPPRLYIAANAPNPEKEDDETKCAITRECTESVDWPCEVKRWYREKHLSAGISISSAISWFFDNEPEGIILEDDVLPNLDFFVFCDELLERYRYDNRIQLISGFNVFFEGQESKYSYYMSKFLPIWGWASWRRVWETYEYDLSKLPTKKVLLNLKNAFPSAVYRYYKAVFYGMQKKDNDTWDHQFFFNQILYDRYSIIPYLNMTSNIGCGTEDAVHSTNPEDFMIDSIINHKTKTVGQIIHPSQMYFDTGADQAYAYNAQVFIRPLCVRIIDRIKRVFNRSN